MQAKKSFGQHFLNREDIAKKIANSLTLLPQNLRIVEVGPGQGMLTKHLLNHADTSLRVVEADRDMVGYLEKNYPTLSPNIIFSDFLRTNFDEFFEQQPFCLIGNFPYNISSQILIKMLDNRHLVPEMVGMFQKEMAERVVAPSGSKTYGVIGILCQAFYDCQYLFTVDKSCFSPPPKVQSAVIRLVRKENYDDLGCSPDLFRKVVKQAFSQRRKMLRNTLKPFFQTNPEMLEDKFYQLRPEQINLQDFIALTNKIASLGKKLDS